MESRWMPASMFDYTNEFKVDRSRKSASILQVKNGLRMKSHVDLYFSNEILPDGTVRNNCTLQKLQAENLKKTVSNTEWSAYLLLVMEGRFQFILGSDVQQFPWRSRNAAYFGSKYERALLFQKTLTLSQLLDITNTIYLTHTSKPLQLLI